MNNINLIENISTLAKRDRWKLFYDEFVDSLYWTKSKISDSSKLRKLSKEVSFYLNSNGLIEGLVIQYFKNNFLNHNKDVAEISKLFTEISKNELLTIPKEKRDEAKDMLLGFSESIKKDIYRDALEANYNIDDLNKVLTT